VKTCFTASGSLVNAQVPSLAILSVNQSPKRRCASSMNAAGLAIQRAVWSGRGIRGPGGNPAKGV
jgi:hypothetical protein